MSPLDQLSSQSIQSMRALSIENPHGLFHTPGADASSIPVFQDVPASDALETQAIMVGRCLGRDDRRSTLPVRHHQAVIEDASAVQFVGVESPRG